MMGGVERYRIKLLSGKIPGIRCQWSLVITSRKEERKKEESNNGPHRYSSGNVDNQTQDGSDDRRLT